MRPPDNLTIIDPPVLLAVSRELGGLYHVASSGDRYEQQYGYISKIPIEKPPKLESLVPVGGILNHTAYGGWRFKKAFAKLNPGE